MSIGLGTHQQVSRVRGTTPWRTLLIALAAGGAGAPLIALHVAPLVPALDALSHAHISGIGAAAGAVSLLVLVGCLLRAPRAGDDLLASLVSRARIVALGRVHLALWAMQHRGALRILVLVHSRREQAGHLRVKLAAVRGRRGLAGRLPPLRCELPSASLVMARLEVPLHAGRRARRVHVGLSGMPRLGERRNGVHGGGRSGLMARWGVRWMRLWHGAGVVAETVVWPIAPGDRVDPLDRRPEWQFHRLWSPGEPTDATDVARLRQQIDAAMGA